MLTAEKWFPEPELQAVSAALDLIEKAVSHGNVPPPLSWQSTWREVVHMLLTKVLHDIRAVLCLIDAGYPAQCFAILRASLEAGMMVVHIGLRESISPNVRSWLLGNKIAHWEFADKIDPKYFDMEWYKRKKYLLDRHVHPTVYGITVTGSTLPWTINTQVSRELREIVLWILILLQSGNGSSASMRMSPRLFAPSPQPEI